MLMLSTLKRKKGFNKMDKIILRKLMEKKKRSPKRMKAKIKEQSRMTTKNKMASKSVLLLKKNLVKNNRMKIFQMNRIFSLAQIKIRIHLKENKFRRKRALKIRKKKVLFPKKRFQKRIKSI